MIESRAFGGRQTVRDMCVCLSKCRFSVYFVVASVISVNTSQRVISVRQNRKVCVIIEPCVMMSIGRETNGKR
jgi:hypothetical protein